MSYTSTDPLKHLLYAAYNNHIEVVAKMFVEQEKLCLANIDNAAYHAVDQGHLNVLQFLVAKKNNIVTKNPKLILCAAREGHLKIVEFLHDFGSDINGNGSDLLITASRAGHLDIVKYIMEHTDTDLSLNIAMCKASKYGHLETLKYLVENGANINAKNNYAIKYAAKNSSFEILEYLLSNSGSVDIAKKHASVHVQAWFLSQELNTKNSTKTIRPKI